MLIIKCFNIDKFKNKNKIDSAVIIEPRNHLALESVIQNIINNLNVPIIIFHGKNNIISINNIISKNINHKFKLFNLNVENLSSKEYNKILLDKFFWERSSYFGNKILIFQTDSGICNKNLLGMAADYSYCGAPWVWNKKVGNGGFSIRDTSIMIDIINYLQKNDPDKLNGNMQEDIIFTNYLNKHNKKSICPYNVAKIFSRETDKNDNKVFGFHAPWRGGNKNLCEFSKYIQKLNNK